MKNNGIMAGKFPPLNWFTDEFTVWCVQNANNINLGILYGSLQVGLGVGSGNLEQTMRWNRSSSWNNARCCIS